MISILISRCSTPHPCDRTVDRPRADGAFFFAGFAGAAWLLAATSLAGVVGYSIILRTRELGIRLALGAPPATLVRGLVVYGSGLTPIGLAAGVVGGAWVAHAMSDC